MKVQRACRVVNLPRSLWYYEARRDDTQIIEALEELARELPTRGFDSYFGRLRAQGHKWNRKRVLRVYRKLNLGLRRKRKRRLPTRIKQPLAVPKSINRTWSADFMHDTLDYGRKVRVLNIIDDFSREALVVKADYSHSGDSVVRVMEELIWERSRPKRIRVDNGPEFVSKVLQKWCKTMEIEIQYIQPGKPVQNAYIERFNRWFREDVLDAYIFDNLKELQRTAEEWKDDYNLNHPHSGLNGLSPKNYVKSLNLKLSTNAMSELG